MLDSFDHVSFVAQAILRQDNTLSRLLSSSKAANVFRIVFVDMFPKAVRFAVEPVPVVASK